MRMIAAVVVVLVLLGGACGRGSEPEKPTVANQRTDREATVSVRTTGAVELAWEERTPLSVVTVDPGRSDMRLLTVGLAEFKTAGAHRFRTAFDLVGTDGSPGRYDIPLSSGGTFASGSTSMLSAAFIDVMEATGSTADRFARVLEPCQVELGAGRRTGSLTCPRLADPAGAEIRLEVSWRS